jgi:hypothetical protein
LLWLGTALILLGVLFCLFSLVRYRRVLRELPESQAAFSRPSTLAISVAVVLATLGGPWPLIESRCAP